MKIPNGGWALSLFFQCVFCGVYAQAEDASPVLPTREDHLAAQAFNAFGQDIFMQYAARPGNFVYSSFSTGMAMAMLLSGARGQTRDELLQATHLGPDAERAQTSASQLQQAMAMRSSDGATQFESANALLIDRYKGADISQNYRRTLEKAYQAEIFVQATLETINQWASKKTHDKIPKLLPALEPNFVALIVNAAYWRGAWEDPFKPVGDQVFTLSSNEKISTPMISRTFSAPFYEDADWRAIASPYKGGRVTMIFAQAKNPESGARLGVDLNADIARKLTIDFIKQPHAMRVALTLPKFKIKSDVELKDMLMNAGVRKVFDESQANLTGVSDQQPPLYVSQAKQAAMIEIDERGAVAAAVTGVQIERRSMPAAPRLMTLDRPFLFFIFDQETQSILFSGRLEDPRAE